MNFFGIAGPQRHRLVQAAVSLGFLLWMVGGAALRASDSPTPDPHAVPVVDGGIGPCSVLFTVKDAGGSPVYNSKIRVHIAYGLFSAHKLDLEVGTNVDGKGRFTGLPNRVKRPLQFQASQGDREGSDTFDPADNCRTERPIVIAKPTATATQP